MDGSQESPRTIKLLPSFRTRLTRHQIFPTFLLFPLVLQKIERHTTIRELSWKLYETPFLTVDVGVPQ
ncbi:hypothetical protein KIN20_018879 [Parelaphostrongylus tenuis]|uniref:Uncharacterized protein n=1 Tax=Parelaphostrongylus tenuis TaxID=148309 RepID=A0AAD5MQI1_PARTN|nr:hypothetical protein KIN20_018879 [Parelaphostrongylus tenuis]